MLWVKIKADLERALRESAQGGHSVCAKVVEAIEAEKAAVAAKASRTGSGQENTWRWMLIEFRKSLGADLAVPPTPSSAWVQTQVSRCRRLGLNEQQISDICRMARLGRRPPYALETLLRYGPELLSEADRELSEVPSSGGGADAGKKAGGADVSSGHSRVYTGRSGQ